MIEILEAYENFWSAADGSETERAALHAYVDLVTDLDPKDRESLRGMCAAMASQLDKTAGQIEDHPHGQ